MGPTNWKRFLLGRQPGLPLYTGRSRCPQRASPSSCVTCDSNCVQMCPQPKLRSNQPGQQLFPFVPERAYEKATMTCSPSPMRYPATAGCGPLAIDQAQAAHRRQPKTCSLTRSWLSRETAGRSYRWPGVHPSARASARMSILPTLTRTVTACATREGWCKLNPKRRRPDTNCSHQAIRRPRGPSVTRHLSIVPQSQRWAHARRQRPRSTPNPAPSGTQARSQRNTDPRWLPSSPQHPGSP